MIRGGLGVCPPLKPHHALDCGFASLVNSSTERIGCHNTIEWDTLYFRSTFQVFFAFEDKTGFPLADCLITISCPNSTIKLD